MKRWIAVALVSVFAVWTLPARADTSVLCFGLAPANVTCRVTITVPKSTTESPVPYPWMDLGTGVFDFTLTSATGSDHEQCQGPDPTGAVTCVGRVSGKWVKGQKATLVGTLAPQGDIGIAGVGYWSYGVGFIY